MKTYTKVLTFGLILVASMFLTQSVHAMTPTLSLSSLDMNNVTVSVNGDPNSNVFLHYNSNYGTQSSIIGSTNNYGYFSTTLNPTSYNINQNSYVYVIVNNQQSTSMLWPTYNSYPSPTNTSGVNVSSLVLPVGGSATLSLGNNTSGLYVSSNSNPSIVSTGATTPSVAVLGCTPGSMYSTITGQSCYYNYNMPVISTNTVTVNALYAGYSTLTICQNQSSVCGTVTISVVNNNVITGTVLGASTTGNACFITRTLRLGMSGPDVACLQSYLINKGYLVSAMNYGSYFDINTQSAVMAFQQNNYLVPDGIVGRLTRAYLY